MITISATEFAKNFGRYKEAAQREPIAITSYGALVAILSRRMSMRSSSGYEHWSAERIESTRCLTKSRTQSKLPRWTRLTITSTIC